MEYIKRRPYFLFLIVIAVLLSFGFYKEQESTYFNMYDTYYVISWKYLMFSISVIYGIFALLYFGFLKLNFRLLNWITIFHVLVSIIGLLLIFTLNYLIRDGHSKDFLVMLENISFNEKIGYGIWITIFMMLGVQILFFINIIYALIKKVV